jgi:hypothetical protein
MTLEHRLVVGLDDIRAIVFECQHKGCGAKLTRTLGTIKSDWFHQCPACRGEWLSGNEANNVQMPTSSQLILLRALEKAHQAEIEGALVHIRFELDAAACALPERKASA